MRFPNEHHPVAAKRTWRYYQGNKYMVSTLMVPMIIVRGYQGTQGYTGDRIFQFYRPDMYVRI